MKVKVFHIRLTKEHLRSDQQVINDFMETVSVQKIATELSDGQTKFWSILVFYTDKKANKNSSKFSVTDEEELTPEEKQIYEALKHWRREKATQQELPSYMICHNTELMSVAKAKPKTNDDLIKISGFGEHKIEAHGEEIIALVNSF